MATEEHMKACLLTPNQPLQISNLTRPCIEGNEEVLVRVLFCGICHTDLHLWNDGYDIGDGKKAKISERPGFIFPVTPGHEIAGKVAQIGTDVEDLKVGDTVIIYPIIGCDECESCQLGKEQVCLGKSPFIGFSLPGGFAEYVKIPKSKYACKIPDAISPSLAALLPCGAATSFSALKKANALVETRSAQKMASSFVLIGAGGLGQWALALSRHILPKEAKIIVVDTSEERLRICDAMGADKTLVCNPDQDVGTEILKVCPSKCDIVLDFVGCSSTVKTGASCLKRGGTLFIVGLHGGNNPLQLGDMVLNSKTVQGTKMSSLKDLKELIELVGKQNIKGPSISFVNLDDNLNNVMEAFKNGEFTGRNVIKM
eukprot:Seg2153.4 transcript_id=Seg2153.4/GoldUCD/mRNA.D3Y31 product="NAD-dependent alcohol dehydrogenase" protein_id=Seg2153.4/GoldUCD/D3Y31